MNHDQKPNETTKQESVVTNEVLTERSISGKYSENSIFELYFYSGLDGG